MEDYSSMSKEELELLIKELTDSIKALEGAINKFVNAAENKSSEIVSKLQDELRKAKEGVAKLEELLEKHDT